MLLEFKCSNHKSMKEEVVFSMIAGSDHTSEALLKDLGNYRVLRSAVIYGANGSGKSNFISAISFMRELVCNSIHLQPGQKVFQAPHKLSDKETPSVYAIQFIKNDIRYAYGFSIRENLVHNEYLYYFPKGRQVKIFEREGMEIKPNGRYKKSFDVSLSILKNNRLFLSCAANYSSVAEIEEAFKFFAKEIVIYNPEINNWTEYSIESMQSDSQLKNAFLRLLQALGTGAKDISVKSEKVKWADIQQEITLPDALRTFFDSQIDSIDSKEGNKINARIVYDDFETDLISEESTGIKRLFELLCPIIDILNKGKTLICDEFDASLHESIIYQIIEMFHDNQTDKPAQLIFSTHNTSLLDTDLFRRDQIWFTQLNEWRATDLYSLVEIKSVRKTENLKKGYMSGKYGAIPMLNKAFFQQLDKSISE